MNLTKTMLKKRTANFLNLITIVQNRKIYPIMLLGLVGLLISCNKDPESSRLVVKLVDNPADYKEVNVDIKGISVHTSSDAAENDARWVDLEGSNVGVKNLLDFTGGTELTLVDTDFPAGKISQIRLILGNDNSIVIDEGAMALITPSGQQSGLTLQVHETLNAGITYVFTLDFDAARSVIQNGKSDYLLKPVLRVITEAVGGAITGIVTPEDLNVLVTVLQGDKEMATTYAPIDQSKYTLSGIPEGSYQLKFDPAHSSEGADDPAYDIFILEQVEVKTNAVTRVDPVELLVIE